MTKNLFKYLSVLFIAITFLSTSVNAETTVKTTNVQKTKTTVEAATQAPHKKQPTQAQMPPERQFPICIITGHVLDLQSLEKSAWANGVPSSFSSVEAQIAVKIKTRSPRDPKAKADAVCVTSGQVENRLYKICSPTPVRVGDFIQGTEGTDTGVAGLVGCLFDIAVSKEKAKAKTK